MFVGERSIGLKQNNLWQFQKQEYEKYESGVILSCSHKFCLWSLHKHVAHVQDTFHFRSGILPYFTGADRSWSNTISLQRAIGKQIIGPR